MSWVGCRVRSIHMDLDCPGCGQRDLVMAAEGRNTGREVPAMLRCPHCRQSYLLRVELARTTGSQPGHDLP